MKATGRSRDDQADDTHPRCPRRRADLRRARTGAAEDTIALGGSPNSVAFDGSWIWVSQANAGTVSVIDPATNNVVRTINTGAGSSPAGLAFDLTNIWVANEGGNNVMRLRP